MPFSDGGWGGIDIGGLVDLDILIGEPEIPPQRYASDVDRCQINTLVASLCFLTYNYNSNLQPPDSQYCSAPLPQLIPALAIGLYLRWTETEHEPVVPPILSYPTAIA